MRLLIVTYYFPPAGGGGVQRVLSWCKHLNNHDIDVTILAPQYPKWVNTDTTLVVPVTTTVIRTDDPSPVSVIPREELAATQGVFKKIKKKIALQPRRFLLPDIHIRWKNPAINGALNYAKQHGSWDLVLSSSPPETTHVVASEIAKSLGIPWVADYRDSWLDLPHLNLDKTLVKLKYKYNARLAKKLMDQANAAITVSDPLANDLRKRHPNLNVYTLENGVEFDEVQRAQERSSGFIDKNKFVITYTGNFFGKQTPHSFLNSLEAACKANDSFRQDVIVRFIGGLRTKDKQLIESSSVLSSVIEHQPFLRHDDVLSYQAAADLLFLYVAPGIGSEGVFTGKVFEYIAARRPVITLSPKDNVCTKILDEATSTHTEFGGASVEPDNESDIQHALLNCYAQWKEKQKDDVKQLAPINVPEEVIRRIDRRYQSKQLADLLHSLDGGNSALL